jgi:hypothetical protein
MFVGLFVTCLRTSNNIPKNVTLARCLTRHHALKTYWGWKYSATCS